MYLFKTSFKESKIYLIIVLDHFAIITKFKASKILSNKLNFIQGVLKVKVRAEHRTAKKGGRVCNIIDLLLHLVLIIIYAMKSIM
jgi:hypothetical protein